MKTYGLPELGIHSVKNFDELSGTLRQRDIPKQPLPNTTPKDEDLKTSSFWRQGVLLGRTGT